MKIYKNKSGGVHTYIKFKDGFIKYHKVYGFYKGFYLCKKNHKIYTDLSEYTIKQLNEALITDSKNTLWGFMPSIILENEDDNKYLQIWL